MAKKLNKVQETELVTDFAEAAIPEETKITITGVANTKVNVRAKSSLESKINKVLEAGEEIVVKSTELVNGFYPVVGGFIKAEYLSIKEA